MKCAVNRMESINGDYLLDFEALETFASVEVDLNKRVIPEEEFNEKFTGRSSMICESNSHLLTRNCVISLTCHLNTIIK